MFSCWVLVTAAAYTALTCSVRALGQCEITDLWASDGAQDHFFGRRVGASDDLATLVIAASGHDSYRGAAYIFVWDAIVSGWIEHSILSAPDPAPFAEFGSDVTISPDGRTVVVGEIFDDNSGFNSPGAAHVFVFDGAAWLHQAKLTASDPESNLWLGGDVRMTPDASRIVVGARGDGFDAGGSAWGAAYVYDRPKGGWADMTETVKLNASDLEPGSRFGNAVAISADGNVIVVGAEFNDEGGSKAGAVYIFLPTPDRSDWVEHQKFLADDATAFWRFGFALAVSPSADTIVIASISDDEVADSAGSAYIFVRQGEFWVQQAKVIGSGVGVGDFFGMSVDLSDDGDTALIGTSRGEEAYVFTRNGSVWTEQAILTTPHDTLMRFGTAVALTGDGTGGLIGAIRTQVNGMEWVGSAHVFDLATPCPGDIDGDGMVGITDLLILLASWGPCADCDDCPADLDGNCTVGVSDLLILLSNWG